MKKLLRYVLIFLTTSSFLLLIGGQIIKFFWNFDIFGATSYIKLTDFWENGGVFKTFKDISLILCLLLLPIFIIISTNKLYKKGFWKTVLYPLIFLYKRLTRPKNLEPEYVSIKNLGAKDRTLEEIISEKIKEKGQNQENSHTIKDIRNQISQKIQENETQ